MTTNQDTQASEEDFYGLEDDLPLLACQAAIELDNLILDRPSGFASVGRLIRVISCRIVDVEKPAEMTSLLDPTTVVAMDRAMIDAGFYERVEKVTDLIRNARQVTTTLRGIVKDPQSAGAERPDEVEKMRTFCLQFSKQASAFELTVDEFDDMETQHLYLV